MAHVTDAEFAALIDNCTTTWTTRNGVYGRPLLVLHAAFGEFRLRVVPLLRFGLFQPVPLLPLLGSPGASSPRICQVARELRARQIFFPFSTDDRNDMEMPSLLDIVRRSSPRSILSFLRNFPKLVSSPAIVLSSWIVFYVLNLSVKSPFSPQETRILHHDSLIVHSSISPTFCLISAIRK